MKKKNLLGALLLVGILVSCNNEGLISGSSSSSAPSTTSSSSSNSSVKGESSSSTSSSESSSVNSSTSSDGNSSSSSSSSNGEQNSSVDSSESSDSSVPPQPTFQEKAAALYSQYASSLGNTKVFYTDGNEYMAFDDSNTSYYLGTYNEQDNTFSENNALSRSAENHFEFTLTNDAYLVLINKKGNEDPSDDAVYSLLEESGVSEKANSSLYDPYYYLSDENTISLKKDERTLYALEEAYKEVYTKESLPTSISQGLYTLKAEEGKVTIPSKLFNKDITKVGNFSLGEDVTTLELSNGITTIGDQAFSSSTGLTSVILPDSLTTFDQKVFNGCQKLETLELPANVSQYAATCFLDSGIKNLVFPSRQSASFHNISGTILSGIQISFKDNSNTKFDSFADFFKANPSAPATNVVLDINPSATDEHTKTYDVDIEELSAGKTIVVPTSEEVSPVIRQLNDGTGKETAYDPTQLYAQLRLTKDLVVKGTIQLAAKVSSTNHPVQGHISGLYTQIDLNGHKLTIENGGSIECNGKIVDTSVEKTGRIVVNSGATITSDFIVDDFYGGSVCAMRFLQTMVSGIGVSPFNKYRMSYIEPTTEIHYGAKYLGYCVLYADAKHNVTTQTIVGEAGLFELESEDAYIEKTVDAATRDETINIYGNAKHNSMSINVGSMDIASTAVIFPLPRHYRINIKSGTFSISTMLKVLPGAEVTVDKGATLKLDYYQDEPNSWGEGAKHGARVIIYDDFWDYKEETKKNFEGSDFCSDHLMHEYPYYDPKIDPTLTVDGKDKPGKLTINGTLAFSDCNNIFIAGDVYTSEENFEALKNAFEAVKEKVTFSMESLEGSSNGKSFTSGGEFITCFTMKKDSIKIYVGEELKATITSTPAA